MASNIQSKFDMIQLLAFLPFTERSTRWDTRDWIFPDDRL